MANPSHSENLLPDKTAEPKERNGNSSGWTKLTPIIALFLLSTVAVIITINQKNNKNQPIVPNKYNNIAAFDDSQQQCLDYNDVYNEFPEAMSDQKLLSRKSRALKLKKGNGCMNVNCFAGFDFDADFVQAEVDASFAEFLINSNSSNSTAINKLKTLHEQCLSYLSKDKSLDFFKIMYNKIMDVEVLVDKLSQNPNVDLAEGMTAIAIKFWQEFGVDILFELRTFWNFDSHDTHRDVTVYLGQKIPPALDKDIVQLAHLGTKFTGRKSGAPDLLQFFNHSANSRIMQTKHSNSPNTWQTFNVVDANSQWNFFDFDKFFWEMHFPQNNHADEQEMAFVVESTAFLDAVNDYVTSATKPAAFSFIYFIGFYTTLYEYHFHFLTEKHQGKSSSLKAAATPCSTMLRQFLPEASSKFYLTQLENDDIRLTIKDQIGVRNFVDEVNGGLNQFLRNHDSFKYSDVTEYNYHGLEEFNLWLDENKLDLMYDRLRLKDDALNTSFVENMVNIRKFRRLRDILALSHTDQSQYFSYYTTSSVLTVTPLYRSQDRAFFVPVGFLNMLQQAYDMHGQYLDENTRYDKMLALLKCLLRQESRRRLDWENFVWQKTGTDPRFVLIDEKNVLEVMNFKRPNCNSYASQSAFKI